jgi:beta-lactamase class A
MAKLKISVRHALLIVFILLAISVMINIVLVSRASKNVADTTRVDAKGTSDLSENSSGALDLLFPFISSAGEAEFSQMQKYYRSDFQELKQKLNRSLNASPGQQYSLYFESLNSGAHIGFNEKEPFAPGSLRKVPLAVAAYKLSEDERLDFNQNIQLVDDDLDSQSGTLYQKGSGYTLSVRALLDYMLTDSDNTAAIALYRIIGVPDYVEAMLAIGLSFKTLQANLNNVDYPMSAKEYANVFRSLYYSEYLKREDSQEILVLLTKTSFHQGIPAGVPAAIQVAHKTAFWTDKNQHHDCGIVYYPKSPYLLCLMTVGMTESESNQFMSSISKTIYTYIDEQLNNSSAKTD